jgi:hypothetical protein
MVDVPGVLPFTAPVAEIVATAALLLLQVPDAVAEFRVVVNPTHTLNVPVIAAGSGLIVTIAELLQPLRSVQVMIAVPAATPVTIPVVIPTDALGLPHDQVTGVVAVLNGVVFPSHTCMVPVIGAGKALTTTF